jgi:CHAD domain-containing protein
MRTSDVAEWMQIWQTWLHEPMDGDFQGDHADRELGRVVAKRIARVQANLVERGRVIRPDTPAAQIHDLRKDAKKVRYLFECFASLLPNGPRKAFVRRLKVLQDNLGEHQDAEVHITELREIARVVHEQGASSDTMLAIGQLSEQLDQRRHAAHVEFASRFADYDTKATRRALDKALDALRR